jgi:hypothetical protein
MDSCRQNLPPVEVLHLFQCQSKRFQNIGHWEMLHRKTFGCKNAAFGHIIHLSPATPVCRPETFDVFPGAMNRSR